MLHTAVVHIPHIHHFPPSRLGNLFGQPLRRQRREGRLDDVHLVARARRAGGEVGDSGGAGEFVDEMLAAIAEACDEC